MRCDDASRNDGGINHYHFFHVRLLTHPSLNVDQRIKQCYSQENQQDRTSQLEECVLAEEPFVGKIQDNNSYIHLHDIGELWKHLIMYMNDYSFPFSIILAISSNSFGEIFCSFAK